MLKSKLVSRGIKSILASVVLSACVGASAQTITAVMHAPLRAVDPVVSTAYILRNYGYMVYDTLLARDAEQKIQPQMASWKVSADGKTYTFTLRAGLKWHDGTPVTAADCLASVKRWSKTDKMGQIMASFLSESKVIDDKSFEMKFSQSTDLVLKALSKPSGVAPFMMPKAVADTPITQAITSTIGSGPFKFNAAEYKPGIQAVFDKFTDYVPRSEPASGLAGGKVVKVDRVKWVTMPDPMTAMNELLSNEVDFIEQAPVDLLPMVEGNTNFVESSYALQSSQNGVRLNWTQPPFDNLKVRQAAQLAIGQKPLLESQVGSAKLYKLCAAALGCGTPYASNYGADKVIEAQPEKARALLKEAGYTNAPVVFLHATDNAKLAPMGPVFAQQLRAAGFNVQLQSMDWATVASRRASKAPVSAGGWSMFASTNTIADTADPLGYISMAAGGDTAWFGWPNVPEIEAIREKFALTSDPAEAKKLGEELQKLVVDKVVMIPAGEFNTVTVKNKNLQNQLDGPVPVFWNMTKTGK